MDEEIGDEVPLPEVQDAVLDEAFVARLFADVGACTELRSVTTKGGPELRTDGAGTTLAAAHEALRAGVVVGVQLRYVHEGRAWCDTILRRPDGFRVVRIEAP